MRLYKYIETKAIHVQLRFLHNANYIKSRGKSPTATATPSTTATTNKYHKRRRRRLFVFFAAAAAASLEHFYKSHRPSRMSVHCAVTRQGVKKIITIFCVTFRG